MEGYISGSEIPHLLTQTTVPYKTVASLMEKENHSMLNRLNECMSPNLALQEILEGILLVEENSKHIHEAIGKNLKRC